jgi:hypothetical protein
MSSVDSSIYVALPEALGLTTDNDGVNELHESLFNEAANATSITILGGYMNPDYVKALCAKVPKRGNRGRSSFPLRIAIGIEPSRPLAQQWAELRKLKADLQADGFRSVEVKAVLTEAVHFHTKLFGFIRSTIPTWYVGSANPSGTKRHEMMVKVKGKHKTIAAYAEAALAKAQDVSTNPPVEVAHTLPAFFRSGYLAHKPTSSNIFTFNAYNFTQDERRKLEQDGGELIGVIHANPTIEGYGFRLDNALGAESLQEGEPAKARKVSYTGSSVETVFGYWMPAPYAGEISLEFKSEEAARGLRLSAFAARLCSKPGMASALSGFDGYLKGMEDLLARKKVFKKPDPGLQERFEKFLSSRVNLLKNKERQARLSRIMVLQEMPEIWADERSAKAFEESFFEDVAFRASRDGNKPRIITSIIDGIEDVERSDPDDIRRALVRRIHEDTWTDDDWCRQKCG